jgi:tetratricopeptide (TPR) repeat protein
LRNNLGYALHQAGRNEAALAEFETARSLREQLGSEWQIHVANWMVAFTLRHLGRLEEALAVQHTLEAQRQRAGQPDPYVFAELAALYRALGQEARAAHYERLAIPNAN